MSRTYVMRQALTHLSEIGTYLYRWSRMPA
jgi:hypothetical protein